jgi:hypothetical protein
MESRLLLICLATSLLSSILLFIYFKNRISSVEEKVNVIFQLVQNHEQENKITMHETASRNTQQQYMPTDNLIVISENEEESESDSDSESDNESEDENNNNVENGLNLDSDLVISENIIDENEIKKIALNLEDNLEEVEDIILTKENVEELESNSENDDDENDDQDDSVENEIKQTINYSKFKVDELKQMCQEKELENYKSLRKSELVALLENS